MTKRKDLIMEYRPDLMQPAWVLQAQNLRGPRPEFVACPSTAELIAVDGYVAQYYGGQVMLDYLRHASECGCWTATSLEEAIEREKQYARLARH